MFSIRNNIFETNSSSTHSLVLCKESDYDRWIRQEVYLALYNKKDFIPKEEALKELSGDIPEEQSEIDKIFAEEFYYFTPYTLEDFIEYHGYEDFYRSYTTDSGEKIIAFGHYGESR